MAIPFDDAVARQMINTLMPDNNENLIVPKSVRDVQNKLLDVQKKTLQDYEAILDSGFYPISQLGDNITQTQFSSLISSFSGESKTIILDKNINITSNFTVPVNITMFVQSTGRFTISSGQTLTFEGSFMAGSYKIFYGSGVASFSMSQTLPEWFGVVANGTTVDSSALQLFVNAGKDLNTSNKSIRAGNVRIKENSVFRNALIKNFGEISTTDASAFVIEGVDNVVFENIVFDQDLSVSASVVTRACLIKNSTNVRFKNCIFKNWTDQPIRIDGASNNITVESCSFYNCNRGSASTISANDDYGAVAIFGSSAKNINVCNNKFIGGGTCVSIFHGSMINISNNFMNLNEANVSGMGCWIVGNVRNINVNGNYIENAVNEGIVVTNISNDNAENPTSYLGKLVSIVNNKIRNCLYAGITLDVGFENCVVSSNTIIASVSISHGIYLHKIKDCLCQGNLITADDGISMPDMIAVSLSERVNCAGNMLSGGSVSRYIYANQNSYSQINGNFVKVDSGRVGLSIYPGTGRSNQFNNNFIKGTDTTSILAQITPSSSGQIVESSIIGNIFETGSSVSFSGIQRTIVTNNQFKYVTSVSMSNASKSIIHSNYGFDYKRSDISSAPDFVGELSLVGSKLYIASGSTSSSDWELISSGKASKSYDPPSIAAGGKSYTTVTVPGAVSGDFTSASFTSIVDEVVLLSYVSAADTVRICFWNTSSSPIDMSIGNLFAEIRN